MTPSHTITHSGAGCKAAVRVGHRWPSNASRDLRGVVFLYRRSYVSLFSLLATLLLTVSGSAQATTITATSVSFADVTSAIASASAGDTVIVPAGTATWITTLSIAKSITLQGAGPGLTVITDEVPRVAPMPGLVSFSTTLGSPSRLTGFTFQGGTTNTQLNNNGIVRFGGTSHQFRIDHCTFQHLWGTSLHFFGALQGVVDHCIFNTMGNNESIMVAHPAWGGGDWGHGSWADDPYWGSEKFIFIETNTFTNANPGMVSGGTIDSIEGARWVCRYNTFHDCKLCLHGTEGQGRGAKQAEVYNNEFYVTKPTNLGPVRSGSVLIHDNNFHNYSRQWYFIIYREFRRANWPYASGFSSWDVNDPHGLYASGTHTGATGATTLVDANANWTLDQWKSYIIRNTTTGHQSYCTGNTNTTPRTATYFLDSNNQPTFLKFNTGDHYEIWNVLICLDQTGRGKGDLLHGLPATPTGWPHQVLEPSYSWNNINNPGASQTELDLTADNGEIMRVNRDYYNRTAKPGYTPYTYPHPLVTGVPSPPKNLRILPGL
jgi:hypothetical protein